MFGGGNGPSDEALAALLPGAGGGGSTGMSFMAPQSGGAQGQIGAGGPSSEQINSYLADTDLGQLLSGSGLSVTDAFPNGGAPTDEALSVLISAATSASASSTLSTGDEANSVSSYLA